MHVTYNTALSLTDDRYVRIAQPDHALEQQLLQPSAFFLPHLAPSITNQSTRHIADCPVYPIYITNYTNYNRALLPQQAIGSVRLMRKGLPPDLDPGRPAPTAPPVEQASAFTTSEDGVPQIDVSKCKINPNLTAEQRAKLVALLQKHAATFVRKSVDGPPQAHGVTFAIHTDDAKPVKQVPYRQSPQKEAFIQREVTQLLAKGLIQPSFSPWGSPVLVVDKKDGGMRMCIDYRKLNANTRKDAYPLPRIDDCLQTLKNAVYMTVLDLQDAYHHIGMQPGQEAKTAFVTRYGLYEWCVMPFGATGAPGAFQRHVDKVLFGLNGRICVAYFDDIVTYSDADFDKHLENLATVLETLRKANLTVRLEKCKFAMTEIDFVGHVVTGGTVKPDPHKLDAILEFPAPTNVTHLKSFLGLANYYRRFIHHFAHIAKPL